ncbi:ribonuclease D [Isosphaera pallida ATCC 43644]|uniref:Ribonuclease D n=1 Tax=Isosphaera pallida (strain ATCC 43644 / DSM 9630 / IS1B) TaxID=575540 RepID=E8R2M6_ISOPI|nr:HRDC domain-containing protein [Isosphaera pallida]ADV62526.1 ribonuclease D [Isosphaera pallida ATCC 43644]
MAAHETKQLITGNQALRDLADHLRAEGRFGFDTEFVAEESYEPILCLIQVATASKLVVIDALAFSDLSPFWDAVLDPKLEVVVHAGGEDLRICKIKTGRLPERVFDVQLAAGFTGLSYPLSLTNLAREVLGVQLVGGESRTDWRKRPLSVAQMNYALEDVRHLLDLADALRSKLERMGRLDWVIEETRAFLDDISQNQDADDRWRRLPGLHQLNRRGLEIARRLAEWRMEDAQIQNKPLRFLMKDDLLVAIAKRQPKDKRDLEALRDFNKPYLLRRSGEIIAVVKEAMAVPEEVLPQHTERPEDPPGASMVVTLLQVALSHCSNRHGISSNLLGTNADLRDLYRWVVEGKPQDRLPKMMRDWRAEVVGRSLVDVAEGKVALRVTNPDSSTPVELVE